MTGQRDCKNASSKDIEHKVSIKHVVEGVLLKISMKNEAAEIEKEVFKEFFKKVRFGAVSIFFLTEIIEF